MLIGMLVAHVGRVRDCQAFAEEGLTSKEAAARLKRHPFYVEKLYAQARNYGPDELREAVVRLAELDPRRQRRLAPRGRSGARARADRDHAPAGNGGR
jgi:DNA polymerase III delta subunit